ncbi:MAG: cellulase family glycosylhydrolase [Actinobacteria bacterium]|nr:cellulase family glycosylhydrolase [Actinomycetota bacterium]
MKRFVQFLVAASAASLVVAALAAGAPRMYVGFHDDPNFRYEENRQAVLDQARDANTTIVRTLVTWANIAPTRPTTPADPFDPDYKFDDLDELVRNTQQRGMEVLITIWGTPKWANGGRPPNYLPTNLSDMTTFARAVANRYSGQYEGYPFVRFYSVWNESNLQLFLAPQFDGKGRSIGPKNYARLYAAAYAGIKAGNGRAQVAIGETSAHGRDRKVAGVSDTHSPGRFAQLVAAANPRLKFDAWAHHPYPTPQYLKPTQKVRWPNVTLSSMARFEQSLDGWFKRKNITMWITEYGHEVKQDGEPNGVTRTQQAAYAAQALALAKADARVSMFIWFVFRDHATSQWQSGLLTRDGVAKPSLAKFRSAAVSVDARNAIITVRGGTANPTLAVPLREYATSTSVGAAVGINYRVYLAGRLVAIGQPATVLGSDAVARFTLSGFRPAKKTTYVVEIEANTANLDPVGRILTLIAT